MLLTWLWCCKSSVSLEAGSIRKSYQYRFIVSSDLPQIGQYISKEIAENRQSFIICSSEYYLFSNFVFITVSDRFKGVIREILLEKWVL